MTRQATRTLLVMCILTLSACRAGCHADTAAPTLAAPLPSQAVAPRAWAVAAPTAGSTSDWPQQA